MGSWFNVTLAIIVVSASAISGCSTFQSHSEAERFTDPLVQQLVRVAEQGDVEKVMDMVTVRGVEVDAIGEGGTTPLIWAIRAQSYEGAEALLKLGANPNQVYDYDYTPMWFVAGSKHTDLLELLLKHNGNPDIWKGTSNLLMHAVRNKQMDNYTLLLAYGADINQHDSIGNSIATYAAYRDRYDVLYQVLNDGYTHDLLGLAQLFERTTDFFPDEQKVWIEPIKFKLQQSGVEYPLPPEAKPEPIRLTQPLRAKLEKFEQEGKLPSNSKGAQLLKQDRLLD